MNTTRRYPRTLHQAFPQHHAGSVSGPFKRPLAERVYGVILAVALGICGAAILVHYWSS